MVRPKQNLLQKLHSREIHGTFARGHSVIHNKAATLFRAIPERLMFCLKDVIQHMGNHIMVGTTRCGQFLITYSSYSCATDMRVPMHMSYNKYRLHWWSFRPGSPAYKVAEVQLFDNQDIWYTLTIGIAQWPNVSDKLIVYGYCDDGDAPYEQEDWDADTSRRYYITVTTLPSLHNCKDCKAVAESFDEEDMAANWDTCVGLSCLKHGLTIHTTLDIAPPFPSFDLHTYFKMDNKIIVNTGNFLHVLSFGSDKEEIMASHGDTIVPAEICHNLGEKLSATNKDYICPWKMNASSLRSRKTLTRSVNNAWLNTIMDRAEKVYAFEEPEDGCEMNQPKFKWYRRRRLADKMYEFCSDDEDMENICPPTKLPRYVGTSMFFKSREKLGRKTSKNERKEKFFEEFSNDSEEDEFLFESCDKPNFFTKAFYAKPGIKSDGTTTDSNSTIEGDSNDSSSEEGGPMHNALRCKNMSVIVNDLGSKENIILTDKNVFKQVDVEKRTGQIEAKSHDDVPSRLSCDPVVSNTCDPELSKRLGEVAPQQSDKIRHTTVLLGNIHDNVGSRNNCDNSNKQISKENNSVSSSSNTNTQIDYHKVPPLNVSIINPDLSAMLAEWEADSVSSLSPMSESFPYKTCENKNEAIQSFLERLPGVTISPRGPHSVSRNCSQSQVMEVENTAVRLSESTHSASRVASPNSSLVCKYSPLLVVLRTRNCNQDKDVMKPKEQDDINKSALKEDIVPRVKTGKDADHTMRYRMISGCSVQFDRIYIEVDEEIMSTITDIEDDDQGTGFHCALPLSVHGSAYAQLQMVSSQKAEKMNIHCERVLQTSLEIDQFCFKAAEIICKCEGFKFWFCNDYDVEIIDVCSLNGDILGIACLRLNAEKKPPTSERYDKLNQRFFYEVRCVFIWNPGSDRCWLEAYSQLVDVTKNVAAHFAPAKKEAAQLRVTLGPTSLFTLRPNPLIGTFTHRLWNDCLLAPSIVEIRDHTNLIGFRLKHV